MIIAFAVLFGFKQTIAQKVFLFGAHLQVSKFSLNRSYEGSPLPLHTKVYDQAAGIPGVRHIQAVAMKAGILKAPDELAGVVLKGVGTDYDWSMLQESLVAGRVPDFSKDTAYSTGVLLSKKIADQLRLETGSHVIMYFLGGETNAPRPRKLTVSGIYETGLEEFDNTVLMGDIRMIQRLNNWGADTVASYEIFVKDFDKLDDTYRQVMNVITPDMRISKVTDNYRALFDWMLMIDTNTAVFLVLILFVASFNMVSVLLVLMMERTPMIGLLKAFGGTNGLLRRMFLYVGLNMVVWGLVLGNVIGIGLCWLQDTFRIIPLDPKNYYMSYVPIVWNWPFILVLNIGTVLVIAAVLWLPTFVINRIQPIKALVFKA
ncbi:ABC transporter permease [Arsenicibacter rosenii]|nr:FtsX-like permease family protein [Arsenicibacter rosenii]